MTVKEDSANPVFVPAELVKGEPEINVSAPAAATMVGASGTNPPSNNPNSRPTTTTTTTTYVQAPPTAGGGGGSPQGGLGSEPCSTTCPNCHQQTTTRVTSRIDGVTILAVVLLLLFFWPLFWLPLVLPGCKSQEHYCRNCNFRISREEACSDGCC